MKRMLVFFILGIFSLSNLTAQPFREDIKSRVIKLFVYTDGHRWDELKNIFADKVLLDYSSFSGSPATEMTPKQIVEAWSGFLTKFKATHHQTGNFLMERKENKTTVSCYGTAGHFFPNATGNNVWTVVGTYDFELVKAGLVWKITSMKFNFKYQTGNTDLPKIVQSESNAKGNIKENAKRNNQTKEEQ